MSAKCELALDSDEEIERLLADFLACKLPGVHWTHRAHLAVAIAVCSRMGPGESLDFLRVAINAYNNASGNSTGYNETITQVFVRKIHGEVNSADHQGLALNSHLRRLTPLCGVGWLYQYYSQERIWSLSAKTAFVAPDVRDFDF